MPIESNKINIAGLAIDVASSIRDNLKGELREDADHVIDTLENDIAHFSKLVAEAIEKEF